MNIIDKIFSDSDLDELNNMVRWNGANRIKDETVAHHSYIVTMFARLLSEEIFKGDVEAKLMTTTYAIFHDFDEIFTGDINHRVKHNQLNGKKIQFLLDEYVSQKANEKFADFSNNSDFIINKILNKDIPNHIRKLVKVCDWLSMIYYLVKERNLGNKSLENRYNYCISKFIESCDDAKVALDFESKITCNFEILEQLKNKTF